MELANAAYKERNGRDVFLTDGEYRAKPIALSLFAWGLYGTRAKALEAKFGQIDWKTIHDAAIAAGGWPELGGDPAWGFFKLVVPNPRKNVGGLAAMVAAAGEYYNKPNITVEDVTNPEFQKWLKELMGSVTAISGASAYTAEDFALLGYSVGDGGQMLESDLLANMGGIANRWQDPLAVRYPKYVTWFDFPFSVWMGSETSAAEKNAALEFQKYLLSKAVQEKAVGYGLRPVNADVTVDQADSPFAKWTGRGHHAGGAAHFGHALARSGCAASPAALVRSECGTTLKLISDCVTSECIIHASRFTRSRRHLMSRSYKPSYKTSQPNPGGWITLLIIVVVACALCWPLTKGLINGVNNAAGGVFKSIDSAASGPQPTLTIAVSPEKAELFTQLVNDFNAKKLKAVQRRRAAPGDGAASSRKT